MSDANLNKSKSYPTRYTLFNTCIVAYTSVRISLLIKKNNLTICLTKFIFTKNIIPVNLIYQEYLLLCITVHNIIYIMCLCCLVTSKPGGSTVRGE